METDVPNFSSKAQQKLQQFIQAFSQEIPTVEEAKIGFKNRVDSTKKKSTNQNQALKRKNNDQDVDSVSSKKIKPDEDIPGFAGTYSYFLCFFVLQWWYPDSLILDILT